MNRTGGTDRSACSCAAALPGATLKALRPQLVGVRYDTGGPHARSDVLPALIGFAIGVEFDDNGMVRTPGCA